MKVREVPAEALCLNSMTMIGGGNCFSAAPRAAKKPLNIRSGR